LLPLLPLLLLVIPKGHVRVKSGQVCTSSISLLLLLLLWLARLAPHIWILRASEPWWQRLLIGASAGQFQQLHRTCHIQLACAKFPGPPALLLRQGLLLCVLLLHLLLLQLLL
jgi:hypothetical protein